MCRHGLRHESGLAAAGRQSEALGEAATAAEETRLHVEESGLGRIEREISAAKLGRGFR